MSTVRDGRRHAILAIDTATTQVVIAVATPDGEPLGLLDVGGRAPPRRARCCPRSAGCSGEANLRRSRLDGIVVGTGPGAFTGLRVGLATAKGLAHGLGRPIVGVPTGDALSRPPRDGDRRARDSASSSCSCRPAPPTGSWSATATAPRVLPAARSRTSHAGDVLVAVDLAGRAPDDGRGARRASARGSRPRSCCGSAPRASHAGRRRPRAARAGVRDAAARASQRRAGEVAWSHDPR